MANYATEALVNGQAILLKKLNAHEQRRQMPTVMEMALKNQEFSNPDAQTLRVSPLRTVDVNFNLDIAAGSAVAKTYNHTGNIGDSGKVNVVYVQYVETFSLPRKIAFNSIQSYTSMWANQYEMKWKNLRTRHDNAALAYAYSQRNQLDAVTMGARLASAGLGGYWDVSNNNFALALPNSQDSLFIAQIKAAMASSFYGPEFDVICDIQTALRIENYMNQGAGNQNNTSWQFADCNFVRTQQVIDSNYTAGATLAMPKGSLLGLNWNEGLNVQGVFEDIGGPVGYFTTVADPFGSGAVADLSAYTARADTSANLTGGAPQDILDQWELTLTVGYAVAPLALANDGVIMEIAKQASVS